MNDEQRKALHAVAEMQAALEPDVQGLGSKGWVSKPPDVSRESMSELEGMGFVETFLATGYGDMLFYRLTSAGEAQLRGS